MLRNFIILCLIAGGAFYGAKELGIGEDKTYDVYYYSTPGGNPIFVGRVDNIRDCRQTASMKAQMQPHVRFTGDYTCCLVTEKSNCEKNEQ